MSEDDANGAHNASAWPKAWFDLIGRLTAAGASVSPDTPPPAAARQMRDAFFKVMAEQAEQYMRSPEFLQMMKTSMDSALAWRGQMNEFLRRAYRESRVPSQDDLEDLGGRVLQLQRHVSARLEAIEQQLGAVLESLRPKSPAPRPHKPARAPARAPLKKKGTARRHEQRK